MRRVRVWTNTVGYSHCIERATLRRPALSAGQFGDLAHGQQHQSRSVPSAASACAMIASMSLSRLA